MPKKLKGVFFNIHSAAKLKKMKAEPLRKIFCLKEVALCRNNEKNIEKKFYQILLEFFLKSSVSRIVPKNVKEGTLWDFSTSILSQNIKKLKGEPFGDFFSKKCHNAEKN